ncbi:MAG: HD domain-containing protein [Clostridia bacterium]
MPMTDKRMKHSLAVAYRMQQLATEQQCDYPVAPDEAFMLGLLHDIGYAYTDTPVDHAKAGGSVLKLQKYKYWREVAHHGDPLTKYNSIMLQLLNYVDMTTGPTGIHMTMEERIKEISKRFGKDSPNAHTATLMAEIIKASIKANQNTV